MTPLPFITDIGQQPAPVHGVSPELYRNAAPSYLYPGKIGRLDQWNMVLARHDLLPPGCLRKHLWRMLE